MTFPTVHSSASNGRSDSEGGGHTASFTVPSGVQSGDRLVVLLGTASNSSSWAPENLTAPSGYSLLDHEAAGLPDCRLLLYEKELAGTEGSAVHEISGMNAETGWSIIAVVFRGSTGVDAGTIGSASFTSSSDSTTAPSITQADDDSLFCTAYALDGGEFTGTLDADAAQTEIAEVVGTSETIGQSRIMVDFSERASAGATGTRTAVVQSGTSSNRVAFSFAMVPSDGEPPEEPPPGPSLILVRSAIRLQ